MNTIIYMNTYVSLSFLLFTFELNHFKIILIIIFFHNNNFIFPFFSSNIISLIFDFQIFIEIYFSLPLPQLFHYK